MTKDDGMSDDPVDRLAGAYEWSREPDYADRFDIGDLMAWADRRPTRLFLEAAAEITRLRALNTELVEAVHKIAAGEEIYTSLLLAWKAAEPLSPEQKAMTGNGA